ncbi:MAG: Hsp20/alpha crystallin family protein [Fuerstiella sp.]|nr:Hsp20/alpha crystallin family protein [Fuerstiella sp.]
MSRFEDVNIPSVDVSETDDSIEVKTDLPGVRSKDIDIEIRNDYLTVSGKTAEVKTTKEGNGRTYHRTERRTGSFSRSVRLPCEVQEDSVEAELKDGVPAITLPKAEVAKTTRISVKG